MQVIVDFFAFFLHFRMFIGISYHFLYIYFAKGPSIMTIFCGLYSPLIISVKYVLCCDNVAIML